jgi:hypothetical protein
VTTFDEFVKRFDPINVPAEKQVYTIIPDTFDNLIKFKFFDTPPMDPIVPLVIHKKWVTWYMRKHAQKYWAPFTVASLGSDKYLPTEGEFLEYKEYLEAELPNMYNFTGVVIPGWITLQQLSSTSKSDASMYIGVLDWINREIMLNLFASMNQRDSGGREGKAAAQETSKWTENIIYRQRDEIEDQFKKIYAFHLIGDADPKDFEFDWTPVNGEKVIDIVAAASQATQTGCFDQEEIRRMVREAFPFIDPNKEIEPMLTPDMQLAQDQMAQQKDLAEEGMEQQKAENDDKPDQQKQIAKMKKPAGENKPRGTQRAVPGRPTAVRRG